MSRASAISLTPDQVQAEAEIMAAMAPGERHLLKGSAGTGKSFLMERVVRNVLARKRSVVTTATTHKAVAVQQRIMRRAGLGHVECRTIDSLLSLRPKPNADRIEFVRAKDAKPVEQDVVIVDECGMADADKMVHIRRHLPLSFVLFVGDPAQLPPVGERESQSFQVKSRSELTTIVRQAEGNPILEAATAIRRNQGQAELDLSWMRPNKSDRTGVFVPRDPHRWMREAFTNPEFDKDPDLFRYLAHSNRRVAQINAMVRRWRYGDSIPTPFMPGERAMFRNPLVIGESILFGNSEEATVLEIEKDTYRHSVPKTDRDDTWVATIPAWRITMVRQDLTEHTVYAPRDEQAYLQAIARITDEASGSRRRWAHLHAFKASMADLQPIYALTIHKSQGSTFTHAFVDVDDVIWRAGENLLEVQQLLYVAATRPTNTLVLVKHQ